VVTIAPLIIIVSYFLPVCGGELVMSAEASGKTRCDVDIGHGQ